MIEVLWILGLHMNDERYSELPQTNTQYLLDHGVKYWQPWADAENNLGPVYGRQLVSWHDYKIEIPEDQDAYEYGYDTIEFLFNGDRITLKGGDEVLQDQDINGTNNNEYIVSIEGYEWLN